MIFSLFLYLRGNHWLYFNNLVNIFKICGRKMMSSKSRCILNSKLLSNIKHRPF